MKTIFGILILCVVVTACSKTLVSPNVLTGTWELRNYSGGLAGINKTYAQGNGTLLQFNADSTFVRYTSSNPDTIGKYRILKGHVDFAGKTYDGIYFGANAIENFIILKADTLTIGDPFPDGITSVYVKTKN